MLSLTLGSPCAGIFGFFLLHHSGIRRISRHFCFFTLLFALSGFGFPGFQSFKLLGSDRVGLCFFFQLGSCQLLFLVVTLNSLTLGFKQFFLLDTLFFVHLPDILRVSFSGFLDFLLSATIAFTL